MIIRLFLCFCFCFFPHNFSSPAFAENKNFLDSFLQEIKTGQVPPQKIVDELIRLSKFSSDIPDVIIQAGREVKGLGELLGPALFETTQVFLQENSSAQALGLRKLWRGLLLKSDPYSEKIGRLFFILERVEYFVGSENLVELVGLREEVQNRIEGLIIESRIHKALLQFTELDIARGKPHLGLQHLAQIRKEKEFQEEVLELVARGVEKLSKSDVIMDYPLVVDKILEIPQVSSLLDSAVDAQKTQPEVMSHLYGNLVLGLVAHGHGVRAENAFLKLLIFRPDSSVENNRLRLDAAYRASGPETKPFVRARLQELSQVGELSAFDKFYFVLLGDYGKRQHQIFLMFGGVFLVLLVAVFLLRALKLIRLCFPSWGLGQSLKPGYTATVVREDEYSLLLEQLGLPEDATDAQVKDRYRSLVREYHPDAVRNRTDITEEEAAQIFQELKEAYDRLKDIRSRQFRK